MKIFLSSFTTEHLEKYLDIYPNAKPNVLLSYGLRNQDTRRFIEEYRDRIGSLIIDSGTYTLNNASQESTRNKISFDGYKVFLNEIQGLYDFAFNYDRDFSEDGYETNKKYMEALLAAGHENIIPVVHSYTSQEVDQYLKDGHKIIALGASDDKNAANIKKLAEQIHNGGAKVHALGATNWKMLADSPIAYADSSSWVQYAKYGMIMFWNEEKQVAQGEDSSEKYHFLDNDVLKKPGMYYQDCDASHPLRKLIENNFGWRWYEVLVRGEYIKRTMLNIHFFQTLQEKVTQNHISNGWNFD